MKKNVPQIIYEAGMIYDASVEIKAELRRYGIDDNYLNKLCKSIEDAKTLQRRYSILNAEKKDMTKKEDEAFNRVIKLISVFKNFAKYISNDEKVKNAFHISSRVPFSMNKLLDEGDKILAAAKEYQSLLTDNNFDAELTVELENALKELANIDKEHENEKKELMNITRERDEKSDEIYKMYRYIQKIIINIFSDDEKKKSKFFNFVIPRSISDSQNTPETKN